jgi:hypothetical protein
VDYNVFDLTGAGNLTPAQHKAILTADDCELIRTKIRQALGRDTDFEICGEAVDGNRCSFQSARAVTRLDYLALYLFFVLMQCLPRPMAGRLDGLRYQTSG